MKEVSELQTAGNRKPPAQNGENWRRARMVKPATLKAIDKIVTF